MKIKSFTASKISLVPIKDRWYSLAKDVIVRIYTDCGVITVKVKAGFVFDGRSGGKLIDFIVPNLGSQREIACWLVHDVFGHDLGISFEMTNDILRGMLRCCCYSWFKAGYVYAGVSFSDSWFGQPNGANAQEIKNISLVDYSWSNI